jgi:hypothetical protein
LIGRYQDGHPSSPLFSIFQLQDASFDHLALTLKHGLLQAPALASARCASGGSRTASGSARAMYVRPARTCPLWSASLNVLSEDRGRALIQLGDLPCHTTTAISIIRVTQVFVTGTNPRSAANQFAVSFVNFSLVYRFWLLRRHDKSLKEFREMRRHLTGSPITRAAALVLLSETGF